MSNQGKVANVMHYNKGAFDWNDLKFHQYPQSNGISLSVVKVNKVK